MKVFICEDNNEILKKIEQIIKNYIMINDLSIEIITSSTNPLDKFCKRIDISDFLS